MGSDMHVKVGWALLTFIHYACWHCYFALPWILRRSPLPVCYLAEARMASLHHDVIGTAHLCRLTCRAMLGVTMVWVQPLQSHIGLSGPLPTRTSECSR